MAAAAADRDADEFVARARLLDLPAAVLGEVIFAQFVPSGQRAARNCPSCWSPTCRRCGRALCGHLLAAAGATVVKVEGRARPDGTRRGDPRFFDWMNSSKLSYAIDFRDDDVRQLLEVADVVIEVAPRADPPRPRSRAGAGRPGRIWLRVTGTAPRARRPGRVRRRCRCCGRSRRRGVVFIGDAIADPLTGLAATQAGARFAGRGGGEIVETALAEVAADYAMLSLTADSKSVEPPRIPEKSVPAPTSAPTTGACAS